MSGRKCYLCWGHGEDCVLQKQIATSIELANELCKEAMMDEGSRFSIRAVVIVSHLGWKKDRVLCGELVGSVIAEAAAQRMRRRICGLKYNW